MATDIGEDILGGLLLQEYLLTHETLHARMHGDDYHSMLSDNKCCCCIHGVSPDVSPGSCW